LTEVVIAFGANLGDRGQTIRDAANDLKNHPKISKFVLSELISTPPVGGPAGQPEFLNAAARFETGLSPEQLHQLLVEIETQHGRLRESRWDARSLDLDLLLYGGTTVDSANLTIPHPRMTFRRFVLQPTSQVAADMVHPKTGTTIASLWDHLQTAPPVAEVVAFPSSIIDTLLQSLNDVGIPTCRSMDALNPSSADPVVFFDTQRIARLLTGSDPPDFRSRLLILWEPPEASLPPSTDLRKFRESQKKLRNAIRSNLTIPYLELLQKDVAEAKIEVRAAIQAMA